MDVNNISPKVYLDGCYKGQEKEYLHSSEQLLDHRRPSFDKIFKHSECSVVSYQRDERVGQTISIELSRNNEQIENQNYFLIECEIEYEDVTHTIDSYENDDAFLESIGVRTEHPARHDKRSHKRCSDIQACFEESTEEKIEGLGELPFPMPSKNEVTWLNEEIEEVNIGSQETPCHVKMGKLFEEPLQQELIQYFHDYFELFMWSYKDMPGLDDDFVVHNHVVEKGAIPVK